MLITCDVADFSDADNIGDTAITVLWTAHPMRLFSKIGGATLEGAGSKP